MDSTYCLSDSNLVVTILAVMDPRGLSHIISVGILVSEDQNTLKKLIRCFIDDNKIALSTKQIKCFVTDKDMSERVVIRQFFPHAKLLICQFHVLQIFQRTITMARMGITALQRKKVLKILMKLANSKSQQEYDHWYPKLETSSNSAVMEYFLKNWHCIRHQ